MSGIFGVVKSTPCASDLFYGTDYHSHLGTRRAGLSTIDNGVIHLNIHNIVMIIHMGRQECPNSIVDNDVGGVDDSFYGLMVREVAMEIANQIDEPHFFYKRLNFELHKLRMVYLLNTFYIPWNQQIYH